MKKYLIYIFFIFSAFSCVEEFDLKLDKVKPRLVVEGLIENSAEPHYIRLTKSATGAFIKDPRIIDGVNLDKDLELVEDATVIVSDDTGQIDTLKLVPKGSDPLIYKKEGGFYKTTSFIGVPGRTYFLKVITKEGEIYTASDYMPATTPEIDSASFEKRLREKDGSEYYVSILTFNEPENIGNHYLIEQSISAKYSLGYPGSTDIWYFEVLSDKDLKPGSVSIFLDSGASSRNYRTHDSSPGNIYIKMSSLSIETYDYYKFLLEQFKQDGGAYKPAPASPPTNISNGGLGFFQTYASATVKVSYKEDN